MARDYFDYCTSYMDTATKVCGGAPAAQDGRPIPLYVRSAFVAGRAEDLGLSQEELRELRDNDYAAIKVAVSDNGPNGNGLRLAFSLQGRSESDGLLFGVELELQQARILIAALENALRLRAAQASEE